MKLKNIFRGDSIIWVVFLLLSLVSLVEVYSSIGLYVYTEFTNRTPTSLFLRHMAVVVVTFAVAALLARVDYNIFSRFALLGYWAVLILLVIMIVFQQGRWIRVPLIGQFQPSEVAKVVLVVFVARLLSLKKDSLGDFGTYFQLVFYILLVVGFILPENFSMAALIFIVCYAMLLLGGVSPKYWWRGLALFVAAAVVFVLIGNNVLHRFDIWTERIDHWLHNNPEELTQENMARMAIARGGVLGVGVGNTIYARLMTQAHNDFIFAIIVEEMGMLGGIAIFLLYSIFYFRCIRIAWRCKGRFGALTVAGLGTIIYLQALVNMSVAVGVLPVTGQTLPFISFGGTAYLFLGAGLGIIQSVAADVNEKEHATTAVVNTNSNTSTDESNN